MILRFLPFCAAGIFLAGCAAQGSTPGADSGTHGYLYHDANHPNGLSLSSSQANYSANHGTWLWPPAESDKPN